MIVQQGLLIMGIITIFFDPGFRMGVFGMVVFGF